MATRTNLKWAKTSNGKALEATVCRRSFACMVDVYTAVILCPTDSSARYFVYIRYPDGTCHWKRKSVATLVQAQQWARKQLEPFMH